MFHITEQQHREIIDRMESETDAMLCRQLRVLDLRAQGRSNADIAQATGYSQSRIVDIVSLFVHGGLDAIVTPRQREKRKRNYMDRNAEAEFLREYEAKAASGQPVTVKEIKMEYDSRVGRVTHRTTIYKLMKRHGWNMGQPPK